MFTFFTLNTSFSCFTHCFRAKAGSIFRFGHNDYAVWHLFFQCCDHVHIVFEKIKANMGINCNEFNNIRQNLPIEMELEFNKNAKPKARRALATLLAQLFSYPDGEHCFIRERAHWQIFFCGNRKDEACCGLTHSRSNRNVADNDRTHMFQCVRAYWRLNSCLLAAEVCSNLVSCVIRLCLSSKT